MSVKCTSRIGLALAVSIALLAATGSVRAQGVGNPGQLPPALNMDSSGGWEVGVPTPIPVERDPLGPVWQKTLGDSNGGPFTAVPGQTFHLHEVLVVSGQLPWADWHEDILNPYWDWSGASIFINNAIPAGLVVNNTPGNAAKGGSLSFLFNPVPPGSIVDIFKHLTYNGPPALPPFVGTVRVDQYPTPEPASAALLAAGAIALLRRRGSA